MQVYQVIEKDLLDRWDSLTKDQIRETLLALLPEECPSCDRRADKVMKRGREIDPTAKYEAASYMYEVCYNCNYIYGYSL